MTDRLVFGRYYEGSMKTFADVARGIDLKPDQYRIEIEHIGFKDRGIDQKTYQPLPPAKVYRWRFVLNMSN